MAMQWHWMATVYTQPPTKLAIPLCTNWAKINYPHHAKILQPNANFELADALLLMYAKMCILHGSVSDLVQPLSFRTTDVPASQWSRTWHHPGDGATLTLHSSLFNVFFKFFIPRCIVQESEVPLKKILLWNGASSWGSLKPGRGVFLKVTFCSVKHQVKYRVNLSPNYRPCCYIPRRSARCPRACCPPAGRRPTPPTSSSSRTTSPCQPSG